MGAPKDKDTIELTKTDLLALLRHHIHLPPKDAVCDVEVEFADEFLTISDEKIVVRWVDEKVQTKTEAKA